MLRLLCRNPIPHPLAAKMLMQTAPKAVSARFMGNLQRPFVGFRSAFNPKDAFDNEDTPSSFFRRPNLQKGYRVHDHGGDYKIEVDVPGVQASDMKVDVELDGRVLHVTGGRRIEKEGSIEEIKFENRLCIGSNVDTDHLSADLSNGVLTLTAPKRHLDTNQVRSIPINVSETGEDVDENSMVVSEEVSLHLIASAYFLVDFSQFGALNCLLYVNI